jgi:hypothetical protein
MRSHHNTGFASNIRHDDCLEPPRVLLLLNGAIAHADAEGDERTVDLLLAAKMAAVRRHHVLLAEGR